MNHPKNTTATEQCQMEGKPTPAQPLPVYPHLPVSRYRTRVLRVWLVRCSWHKGYEAERSYQLRSRIRHHWIDLSAEIVEVLRRRDKYDVALGFAAYRAYREGRKSALVKFSL